MTTHEDIRRTLLQVMADIAPEGDYAQLKPDLPLRDQLDIDSYDFLGIVVALHERLRVDIPEADYQRLTTLNGAVDYLAQQLSAVAGSGPTS